MPEGAALRLAIAGKGSKRSLELDPIGGNSPRKGWPVVAGQVKEVLQGMRGALHKIHNVAGNQLNLDGSLSGKTVDKLMEFANDVGYGLFKYWPGELYTAAADRAPGAFSANADPRIVEVMAPPGFVYPFELVKWRDMPNRWEDPPAEQVKHEWWNMSQEARDDPAVRARALLGMSAIVRRGFSGTTNGVPPDTSESGPALAGNGPAPPGYDPATIDNDPKLPMTVFCNPQLTYSQKEIKYLKDAESLINLYGPWPEEGKLAEMAAARYIMNPSIGFDKQPRDPVVTVLHLACHSSTAAEQALRLGGEYGDVSLSNLRAVLMTKEGANARARRPLVFLNACATAVPRVADRSSFTSFLLDQGFRGVLGTLCDISDVVAAHFAVVFYEALLNGRTVGQAMYDARWHLMDKHRNPLGLLYTFYGNVDLKLSRSHQSGIDAACTIRAARR
jgi:hypothetical protein